MFVPSVSVPTPSTPGIYKEMRNRPTVGEGDEPRCELAEDLLHNVTLADIALNLS